MSFSGGIYIIHARWRQEEARKFLGLVREERRSKDIGDEAEEVETFFIPPTLFFETEVYVTDVR